MNKNDRVVATVNIAPLITVGKKYTILGVKNLVSGETAIKISTDQKKRQYLLAKYFKEVEDEQKNRLLEEDL